MTKIIIFVTLLLIVIAGFFVAFMPKEQSITIKLYIKDNGISDKNFTEFVTTNPDTKVFYFCSYENENCDYVNTTVLKNLADNLLVDELENIYYVDLSHASTTAVAKFKRQWGFTQYPAFAIIKSDADGYETLSSLGYNEAAPFSSDDVKNWLITNNIWQKWLKED